jgi:hypothetical protein
MFYYQEDYERTLLTLTQLQGHELPDDYFYIRIQIELLQKQCQIKLGNDSKNQNELKQLLDVFLISPAFGKNGKKRLRLIPDLINRL